MANKNETTFRLSFDQGDGKVKFRGVATLPQSVKDAKAVGFSEDDIMAGFNAKLVQTAQQAVRREAETEGAPEFNADDVARILGRVFANLENAEPVPASVFSTFSEEQLETLRKLGKAIVSEDDISLPVVERIEDA
jgi:hypothetical protein